MSPFHRIEVTHDGRIVRLWRSERRFDSGRALDRERVAIVEALDRIGRGGRGLLIDSRVAPHSTDERLQDEFRQFRLEVAQGFDRVAALVRTKVGILQVRRLCADQSAVQPFDDEAAAIAYLLQRPTGGSLR